MEENVKEEEQAPSGLPKEESNTLQEASPAKRFAKPKLATTTGDTQPGQQSNKKLQPRSVYNVGETRSGGRINLNRQLKERQSSQKAGEGSSTRANAKLRSKTTKPGIQPLLPPDFEEKLIKLARVVKVVKGGRRFSFSAYVVAGNRKGKIGLGHGKANEVQDAIKKATKAAFKNAVEVPIVRTSVPHESYTKFLATRILIKPVTIGRGLVAAGVARIIVELAGYVNITTKVYGSRTAQNVAAGMIKALTNMHTLQQLQQLRHGSQTKEQRRF